MSDSQIDALEDPAMWPKVFDDKERVALRLADAMCGEQTHALADDLVSAVRDHFAEAEVAELILICGQANLNNRAGNAAKQLLGP